MSHAAIYLDADRAQNLPPARIRDAIITPSEAIPGLGGVQVFGDIAKIASMRADSADDAAFVKTWEQARCDALVAVGRVQAQVRGDANPDIGALALALTHREAEFINQPFPPTNAQKLFTMYPVPPGNIEYTTPFRQRTGQPKPYAAGVDIPMSNVSGFEIKAPLVPIVIGWKRNYWDDLRAAASQANIGMAVATHEELMTAARTAISLFRNDVWWKGYTELQLFGLLNYPGMPKRTLTVAMSTLSTPSDIKDEVSKLFTYAVEHSKQVFAAKRMVTSPRLVNFWRRTYVLTTMPITLYQAILDATGLAKIEEAWECEDYEGQTGFDAIFCWNDAKNATSIVQAEDFTLHTPYLIGLETTQPCSAVIGGARMPLSANNVVGIADCSSLI